MARCGMLNAVRTNPRHPIYVISKGRWDSRLTVKALERMKVPHFVVVEPQERKKYARVLGDHSTLLELPFSNLGKGSIPARNWVWEHSIAQGDERHWIVDDNIRKFCRLNRNLKIECATGVMFKVLEDFVDRYKNVALAGPQYWMFTPRRTAHPAFTLNTRIYSCILIKNSLPFRWRGRYNEDTDLSLRVLKDGWCTILCYAFVQDKQTTMMMRGGNTDELYKGDGRLKMAESLKEQHPGIVDVTWRWGRWQHVVDYSLCNNKLVKKKGAEVPAGVNNYGMKIKHEGRIISDEDVDTMVMDGDYEPR